MESTMRSGKRRLFAILAAVLVTAVLAVSVSLVNTDTADASSWVKEYKGTTVSKRTGISRAKYMNWLEKHLFDGYYIGTQYPKKGTGSDHRNPRGSCKGKNGSDDKPGVAAMNCTGFVWHTLYGASGYSLSKAKSKIPCWSGWGGFHRYAIWGSTPNEAFKRFTQLVDQGKIAKGDIIWIWNLTDTHMSGSGYAASGSPTHHINVFVGDWGLTYKSGDYGLWHSAVGYWRYYNDKTGTFYRDMSKKIRYNTISAISPITYSKSLGITVLKFDDYKPSITRKKTYKSATGKTVTATPYAGETSYATNFKINYATYPNGCDTVVVASGKNWRHDMSAAALAGSLNCPIVLTDPTNPSWTSCNMMRKLNPKKVYVIGDSKTITWSAITKLSKLTRAKGSFTRIYGANDNATSERVYTYMVDTLKVNPKDVILVTSSKHYDALSASCYAAWSKSPIILTTPNGPSAKTRQKIAESGSRLVVYGTQSAIPDSVVSSFGNVKGGVKYIRATGYAGNALMFAYAKSRGMPTKNVVIAAGGRYYDAISASTLGRKYGAGMILVDGWASQVTPSAVTIIRNYGAAIQNVYYIGDTRAISNKTRNNINNVIKNYAGKVVTKTA